MNPADAKKMETQRWRSDQPGQIYGSGPSLNFGRGFWDNEKSSSVFTEVVGLPFRKQYAFVR